MVLKAPGPKFPIEAEKQLKTLDRPLIIESAFPGWIPVEVNPHIPIQADVIAREIIESVQAGAATIHVHPRDPEKGWMVMEPLALKEVLDMVFAECPDVFTWNHTWKGLPGRPISYIDHTQEVLKLGNGPRYVEGTVTLITANPNDDRNYTQGHWGDIESVKEGVPWLEANGVKPIFQIYDSHGVESLLRDIIEPGLATWKPFMCCIHMGKHHSHYVGQDPWGHLQLFTSINMLKAAIPDCVVGLRVGGRNWLPLTVAGISMGVDMVGIGMEDCLWMYPHKDEIITKNAEVIRKIVTITREMGRDIATPADVRRILNTEKVDAVGRFQKAAR